MKFDLLRTMTVQLVKLKMRTKLLTLYYPVTVLQIFLYSGTAKAYILSLVFVTFVISTSLTEVECWDGQLVIIFLHGLGTYFSLASSNWILSFCFYWFLSEKLLSCHLFCWVVCIQLVQFIMINCGCYVESILIILPKNCISV